MKKKGFKAFVSLVVAFIISVTCCTSAYAENGVWYTILEEEHNRKYDYQAEYTSTNNDSDVTVRSKTHNGGVVGINYMFVNAVIIDYTNYSIASSTPILYNYVSTSSMSTYTMVTSAGLYFYTGNVGYYQYTNDEGSRVYLTKSPDAGAHVFVPGSYSSSLPVIQSGNVDIPFTNAKGETYGTIAFCKGIEDYPDYIKIKGDHDRIGYVKAEDYSYTPKTEKEINEYMELVESGEEIAIPVYDTNDHIIDTFTFTNVEVNYDTK